MFATWKLLDNEISDHLVDFSDSLDKLLREYKRRFYTIWIKNERAFERSEKKNVDNYQFIHNLR